MKNFFLKIRSILFSSNLENSKLTIENIERPYEDVEGFTKEEKEHGYDEVFLARQSNDLEKMLKATELETTLSNRHFLLQSIVSETYRLRKEEKYKNLCLKFSEKHLEEFHSLTKSLKEDFDDSIPKITTFQYYSTLLTELEEYERAIKTCEMAISYGLDDGTIGGYNGRIKRIKKKMSADGLKAFNLQNATTFSDTNLIISDNEQTEVDNIAEYSIGEIRQCIREVVREAKDTAKVDTGYLKRSIKGDWIERTKSVEFSQVFYGAENGNSKLFDIATRRMPKDLKWKVILRN